MYRVSVNTAPGDHYDLLLVLRRDVDAESVRQSIRWMIALHSQTLGRPGRAAIRLRALGAGGLLHGLGERPQRVGAHPGVRGPPRGRVPARTPGVAEPHRPGAGGLLHRLAPQRPAHRARDGGAHQRGGSRA